MANIEARERVYRFLNGSINNKGEEIAGKGGQRLSVSDKFLINQQVDGYIDEHVRCVGKRPFMNIEDVAAFAPRLQQYGFEVPIIKYVLRNEKDKDEMYRRIKIIKEEEEKNNPVPKEVRERREVYSFLDGDICCGNELIVDKGGQKLSVSDKFLINQEIAIYKELYKKNLGVYPDLSFAPQIAFFAPRLEQYGFEISMADYILKSEMEIAERYRQKVRKKREKESENK